MKEEIVNKLAELGIFEKIYIDKDEYNNHSNSSRYIYTSDYEYYWRIDTKNLSDEEINMLLNIDKAKNIRTIKNIALFFAVITAIGVLVSVISGVRIAGLL